MALYISVNITLVITLTLIIALAPSFVLVMTTEIKR